MPVVGAQVLDVSAGDLTDPRAGDRAASSGQDKRGALGRALANALDDTGTRVDDEIAFVRMLADLDPVHIRVLKIMSRRPKRLDQVAVQMNAADDPKAARQWYAWSIVDADPGLEGSVHGALRVLSATAWSGTAANNWYLIPMACSTNTRSRPMATTSSTG